MFDMRSSSRRVALFMTRATRVRMKPAIGTRIRNIKVSCQLIHMATRMSTRRAQRLGDQLAEQRLEAGSQRFHVVGEAGHQFAGAVLAELIDVEMNGVAVEAIAEIKKRQIDDTADQRFLGELEETLDRRADDDEADEPHQRLIAVGRREFVDVLAADLMPVELVARKRLTVFQLGERTGHVTFLSFAVIAFRLLIQKSFVGAGLFDFGLQIFDFIFEEAYLFVDPILRTLFGMEELEDRVNRGKVEAPENGGEQGRHNRQHQPAAIGQGMAQGAQEVLHVP